MDLKIRIKPKNHYIGIYYYKIYNWLFENTMILIILINAFNNLHVQL